MAWTVGGIRPLDVLSLPYETMAPRKEQFSGCLIGQCLGDALGCPLEGASPARCRSYVTEILRTGLAGAVGRAPLPFGQYTDDSQLARELMQSYVAVEGFDPADYAARIATIFAEKRVIGPGVATATAARRLARGVPWQESGMPPPTAGNGAAMRAAPIGLFFFDAPPRLIQAACDQARITHQDPRCAAGAVAIAGATTLALRSASVDAKAFLSELVEWVAPIEASVATALGHLVEWVALPPDQAAPLIATAGLPTGGAAGWEGISPFVTSSVSWSLYCFLRTPEDYWETICTAIAVGGDVDSTAAMAGAISGAHLGLEAIPQGLAFALADQGTWSFTELVELAHRCHELQTG